MVRQHRMSRSVIVALGVAVGATTLMACGDGVDTAKVTKIGGERFEEIRFKELYRPPSAKSKERKKVDLVQTETLSLEGASPESVLTAYSKVLTADGWTEVQAPQAKRDDSWYGAWTKLGRNVVVTANLGNAEEGKEPPTDFVLSFQRPTQGDRITGVPNKPIVG